MLKMLFLSVFVSSLSLASPKIIAHRGASFFAPEATKEAYALAIQQNADYLEGDIQRTKDGVLVLYHDPNLKRTTNVEKMFPERKDKSVSAFTLEEIKSLDAGSWFNQAFPKKAKKEYENSKILTLDEFLEIAKGKKIYLETKNPEWYPNIEKQIAAKLKNWPKENILLQTFSEESLIKLNEEMPKIQKCFLMKSDFIEKALWAADKATFIGIPLSAYSNQMAKTIHSLGLKIHVYTVNSNMKKIQNEDGIFTDLAKFF